MLKKSLSLLLVLMLVLALFAGCQERPPQEDPPPTPPDVQDPVGDDDPDTLRVRDIAPDFSAEIAVMYEINDHTVGWIEVPGTNISDVVVRNPECRDNLYYLRRNIHREFYFDGIYYIDFRADIGPTREYFGVNTTIYGHAMTDDPDEAAFNIMFGQLHNFRDEEFARYHPYILFGTDEETMVFEIFAIFYGNVYNPAFSYNNNPADPADFIYVIENAVLPRSLFFFDDIEFDETDRFLTLSTCIYNPSCGTQLLHHRYTFYRFGIMARLVDPDAPLREYSNITINENRIVDPDGRWRG